MADQHPRFKQPTSETATRFRSESGEVASWLILMAGLAAAALAAAGVLSLVVNTLAADVAAAAEGTAIGPRTAPETGDGTPRDGGTTDPGTATGAGDGDPLPVRTSHCSLTVNASGDALGLGVGLGSTVEVIIQEMPDGTTIVTMAGDVGANGGTGTSAGAGVTVNDATVGAYASASADAWGAVGGGVQYELAPGETVADLFAGLAVSSNPVTGILGNGINAIVPGTVPTASAPNTIFVDGQVWGAAGGTAQAGVGWVSTGANASGEAVLNQTYSVHDNGTYSATTTYSGELSGDAGATGGVPFFAWGTAGIAAEAQGSISAQTIYDSEFNPISMVVTTSYGYDGDAILGSDDDNPTITTQQWTLDLTDPQVAEAVNNLDAFVPGPGLPQIPTGNPLDSWDVVSSNATTSGAVSQELSTSQVDIAVELGAVVAGVSGGINGTCTELQ